MIYVSDTAKQRISSIQEDQANEGEDFFIRVSVIGGGCSGLSYKLDFDTSTSDTDEIFEHNGMKVVTDRKSMLYIFGTTLDFSEGLGGKGFYFNNPNASRTCSCGESFAV